MGNIISRLTYSLEVMTQKAKLSNPIIIMPRWKSLGSFCFVSFLLLAGLAAADPELTRLTPVSDDQQIPVSDFLRPQLLTSPAINRAGTAISAVITSGEDRHLLLVYDVKTQKYGMIGGTGDYDITGSAWLGNTRVLYSVSGQKLIGIGLFATEIKDLEGSYPLLEYFGSIVVGVPRSDPTSPLIWNSYDALRHSGQDEGVALVNSAKVSNINGANLLTARDPNAINSAIEDARENNERHIISKYPIPPGGATLNYITDKDGNLAFAVTRTGVHQTLYRLTTDQTWTPCPVDVDNGYFCGPGNEAGQLAAVPGHTEGSPNGLYILDTVTGKRGATLVSDNNYDFTGWPYRKPATGEIIGARDNREYPHNIWFNADYRNQQRRRDAFPDRDLFGSAASALQLGRF
jgi:hypothetical protein